MIFYKACFFFIYITVIDITNIKIFFLKKHNNAQLTNKNDNSKLFYTKDWLNIINNY